MWDVLFKTPILNVLFLFYRLLGGNMGLAVIALTLLVRLILVPLTLPAMKSSQKLKALQPKLDALKDKHNGDKAKIAQAQLELYREHGVNPTAGCLPILLSIPVMIALYQVLMLALNQEAIAALSQKFYFAFLKSIDLANLHTGFLWLDLARPDRFYILPVLVGVSQYFTSQQMAPAPKKTSGEKDGKKEAAEEMAQAMQVQFKYMLPLMTAAITLKLPAGVALYWLISTVFGIIQQKFLA